jgi:hypothetical protein
VLDRSMLKRQPAIDIDKQPLVRNQKSHNLSG